MKRRQFILISFFGFLSFVNYYAQNCGLKNPSFEYYSSCPSGFSQYEKVDNWVNILPDLKSEPDYFNESCPNGSFGNFNYTGFSDVDGTVFNPTAQHLCGRIGMYLNKDSGDDARIKEYITQRVDLKSGVTYQIRIQVEKSSFVGSSTLQRDLTFFGYNGSIPTTEVNLCPVGIDSLTAISKNAITTANQTFTVTFTASQNYDYLVLGANCNEILYATATGYIFIDKIELTSTSNTSAFTPIISHVSNDSNFIPPVTYDSSYSNQCKNCFSDYRNKMVLEGNKIPAGITATWGQKASNPESVTFTNPNDSITSLTGTTKLTPGFYMFYYQFSNGTCTMIDSLEVNVRAPLLFTAGPDILNCSGNNDYSYFNSTRSLRYASYPNNLFADANSWNFMELQKPDITGSFKKYYWSMIQKDTTDFVFMNTAGIPHTGNGLCQGSLNARAWIPPFNYIPLRMQIDLQNPQDSIYLVLTVFDECNTQSSDTLLIINNDINLRWDKPAYCIGDTALIYQDVLNQTTCFVTNKLNQKPNLTFTWNIDDTLLSPINLNVTDSLRLVINPGARLGWHKIRLTIFDSITNCSFYDEHSFYVKDSVREFLAGKDIIFCGGNNDDLYDTSIYNYYNAPYQNTRAVGMNARPIIDTINANDYTTWWSMIRENGTEWTFPNPCGIPFDGADEGDVATIFYTTDSTNCGDINKSTIERYWAHSPFARFQIKNARDTVKFIWHLLDICGNDTIEYKDTMVVYMNDLDLPPIVTFHCITDTVIVSQIINSHYRQLVPDSNLIYRWSGPSDIYFVDSTVNDSVKIYFDSNTVRSVKYLRFTVTDTATGCSWFDQTRIDLRIELDSINAGDDIILCNSNFVGQKVKMNAYPDYFSINPNLYSTYWSVVQPSGPDYVFANPCVPFTGTGTDEGLIYTNYSVTSPSYCGSLQTAYFDFSYSNFAEFIFKGYGERKLVWHVIDKCDSTIHLTDTITIKWDFNEPVVSAGPDQNPNCDGAFLTGSPSASSSGTSGCFKWKQISGPDTLELIDSTKRVAQLINLDSVSPGIYQFEYTLGCDFCASTDTMTVTIDSISKPPFQMTWDTTSKICIEDSMIFYGKGGSTYAWFVNDSLIKPYSTDSVFSVASSLDTIKVSVLIKDSVNECISFRQNFFHKFVGRVCYADRDTIYSCGDVCVSTQDLPYGNHSFISCDSLTTKMGATYTLSDTCITYKPVTAPQTWFYDTLCVVLIDTINDIYDTTDVFITNCDSSLFLSCKDDTLYLDNLGNVITIDTSYVVDSIFASTGIDSVYLSNNSFDCSSIGQNSVTVTARNSNFLKIRNCIATVTILDTIKPIVYCHDTTLCLNSNGKVFFDTAAVLTDIIENCTLDSVWINKDSAICNQDSVAVKIYARDQSGNIGECSTFIYVKDTIKPIVYCHDTTLYLNVIGKVFFDTSAVLNSIDENCTIDSVWMNKDSATCMNDTVYTTIFARDNSGNIGQCEAIIFILDTIKPIVFCHDTTLYLNSNGKVYFDTSAVFSSALENCTIDSIWMDKDSADCSLNAVTTTIYARDNSGNTGNCIATITILDTIKPLVNCHDTKLYLNNNGKVFFDTAAVLTDVIENCTLDSVWIDKDSAICNQDTVAVKIYARDQSGNIGECYTFIYVKDTIKPIVYCHDTTLYLNAIGKVFFDTSAVLNSIDENCTIDSVWMNKDSATCMNDTVYTTIFARDNSGNIGQCEAIIFILDTIKPIVFCHDTTLYLNSNGKVYFDTSAVFSSVLENCTVDSIWMDKDSANCSQDSVWVTIYALDNSNNIGQCTSIIYIEDTIKPQAICRDTTLYIQPNGWAVIDTNRINNSSFDNCNPVNIQITKDSFNCADVGINSVYLIITDRNGNKDSCTSTITVIDTNTAFVNAGPNTSYCHASSITMNGNLATGRSIGTWLLDTNFANANTPTINSIHQHNTTISNLIEGEYQFIWNVKNSPCYDLFDTVLVKIYSQPIASLPPDIDLCYENTISIKVAPLTGLAQGFWTNYYNSSNIPGTNYFNDSAIISTILQGGEYQFYFEARNGVCPASRDSIKITRHYIPNTNFTIDTNFVCENGCVTFSNTSTINPPETIVDYEWIVDAFTRKSTGFTICFSETGQKDVRLIATSNFGCKDTIYRPNHITVHPNPIAGFSCNENENINTYIHFIDQSTNAQYYHYSFGDGQSSTFPNPNHNYKNLGNYTVTQIVVDSVGCKDTILKPIEIRDLSIYVPNSFTPNSDGINDVFVPVILGGDTSQIEFLIFNRWGELIFKSESELKGWDGFHQGVLCQQGSYIWKIKVKQQDRFEVKEYTGHVILLR